MSYILLIPTVNLPDLYGPIILTFWHYGSTIVDRSESFVGRSSDVPGIKKAEEIVRGSSDAPVIKS